MSQERVAWRNRAHCFAIAAQMMRHILVDHARAHEAAKRPGAAVKVILDDRVAAAHQPACECLDLDRALEELTRLDPRQGHIVELKYFGGLSEQEVTALFLPVASNLVDHWNSWKTVGEVGFGVGPIEASTTERLPQRPTRSSARSVLAIVAAVCAFI